MDGDATVNPEPVSQTAGFSPEGEPKPTDGTQGAWKSRTIKVKGQEFVVDSEAKAIELMQKGANYDRNQNLLNEKERKMREERAAESARLAPLIEIDNRLRNDPNKARKVGAILNDEPMPMDDPETDDPILAELYQNRREMRELRAALGQQVGGIRGGLDQINRHATLQQQERYLQKKYPKLATDERLEAARTLADSKGFDLVTAFKAEAFDELPDLVRGEVLGEFGLDPNSLEPPRSEAPRIDGLGSLDDPAVRQRLYSDPDLYARWKPQLDADRMRRSGKIPYPK